VENKGKENKNKDIPSIMKTVLIIIQNSYKYYARSTTPDRKQEVQTYTFFVAVPPFTLTRTDFTFGFQIVLDFLFE